jgi:hypothetical protein
MHWLHCYELVGFQMLIVTAMCEVKRNITRTMLLQVRWDIVVSVALCSCDGCRFKVETECRL